MANDMEGFAPPLPAPPDEVIGSAVNGVASTAQGVLGLVKAPLDFLLGTVNRFVGDAQRVLAPRK